MGDKRLSARLVRSAGLLASCPGGKINARSRSGGKEITGFYRLIEAPEDSDITVPAILAVSETGLPLGVLDLYFNAVVSRQVTRRQTRRWLDRFSDVARAGREVTGRTRIIHVCEREADCFELFDHQRRHPRVDLLVRAMYDRVLEPRASKLFATMSAGDPDGLINVEIDGLAARPKSSRNKARPARRKRLATCEMRFRRVTLPATETMKGARR